MKNIKLVIILLLLIPVVSISQQKFLARSVENRSASSLSSHFTDYSLFSINTAEISQYSRASGVKINFELQLPGYTSWQFSINENDILSKNYFLTVSSPEGKIILPKPDCMTYSGNLKDQVNSRVSLTLTNDLIYGMIRTNDQEYFIEPLRYFSKDASNDIYVVYKTADVISDPALTCGVTQMRSQQQRLLSPPSGPENAGLNCVISELAIASDVSMFTRYGSAAAVQAHNIGVINNVIWDYVNAQFNNNIEIVIVTQNVSTIAVNDQLTPAYAGTNSNTILSNFTAWGQAGNFGITYDDAEFWTTRDIDADGAGTNNGIVGLAWVGVICTANRYHILEDFAGSVPTGSGYLLRVLTSHEMGHNFNCSHDGVGSPYIMAPTVQNTSTWSPASITSVDTHVGTRGCLGQCSTAGAPIPDFITNPQAICPGGTIQFTDHSLHGPTSWSWTFPGGVPGTSTVRNPSITFAANGVKIIQFQATNAIGSNSITKNLLVSNTPTVACTNVGVGTSNAGVNSFSLANINKISAGLAIDGNKYMDFSCTDNTMLAPNTLYSVSVNVGTTNPSNEFNLVQLFIDYNNDGDFVDANEAIYSSPSCYIGTHTFSFTTPAAPLVFNQFLRLRVIAKDCIGGVNSCYNVTAGQVEDYSVFFPDGILLSASLLSFEGYHQDEKNILKWQTSSEINNHHFDIERSFTGTSFEYIGRVAGANTTTSSYSYTDNLLILSAYHRFYYRLKIIDRDGNFKYSNIVLLNSDGSGEPVSVYPNPVKKGELLQLRLHNTKADMIEIINAMGQVVYRSGKSVSGTISIPASSSWATGYYILRIYGVKPLTQKFIIQ